MTEKELLEKIKQSAEDIEIPETLLPEQIEKKLSQKKKKRIIFSSNRKIVTAASVCLLCGICGIAVLKTEMTKNAANQTEQNETAMEAGRVSIEEFAEESTDESGAIKVKKQNAGELYEVASSYEEIYEMLERNSYYGIMEDGMLTEGAVFEESVEESIAVENSTVDSFASGTSMKEEAAAEDTALGEGTKEFSTTNLQTQGVDESDIIKTDGNYIYTVSQNKVLITDIRDAEMKIAGSIPLSADTGVETILEMYVDAEKVILITSKYETSLEENSGYTQAGYAADDVYTYAIESDVSTYVYTYDVSNPEKPVLSGCVSQDGAYHTSRKIGDIIYLFTDENLGDVAVPANEAAREDGYYLPLVNGEAIAYDCIYLPENGNRGLIISSVNVEHPDEIVDKTMILNDYVEIYVGKESCYLYNTSYKSQKEMTEIAKFSFSDGNINAVAATAVEGLIYDTFAINEKNGKLRVLTTVWNDNSENTNSLSLFDENLILTGSLNGIAPGEDIYAARYIGDIAYFITYRNIDPLFAVDISDETAPKILGELEITGFSEYLHPWGEDKLLGIGYETDPDTGITEGIKLVMFDISNPTELKVLDTVVIENVDYCAALYNYKCVIAEENANIIGFATEEYTSSYDEKKVHYLAFGWENGAFKNLLAEKLGSDSSSSDYRGIYVDDKFFIAGPKLIRSFQRMENYQKINEILF